MGRIKIDVDSLRTYVSTINGRISEYEALNGRMDALNSSIGASWKGDAKGAFETMMSGYLQQTKQLGEIMVTFRTYAQDAADRFESVDAECASRIRGSF